MDLSNYPLPLIFIASLLAIFVATEIGRRAGLLGARRKQENISTIEGAILGLLALLIAFTFSMALSLYEVRRDALLIEANAIGTTALRARLLPSPYNTECLKLLREYIKIRLDIAGGNGVVDRGGDQDRRPPIVVEPRLEAEVLDDIGDDALLAFAGAHQLLQRCPALAQHRLLEVVETFGLLLKPFVDGGSRREPLRYVAGLVLEIENDAVGQWTPVLMMSSVSDISPSSPRSAAGSACRQL